MWNKLLFILACLTLPIAWGVLVNWLFDFWQERKAERDHDRPIFPDYQI